MIRTASVFQSTFLREGVTSAPGHSAAFLIFQSTLPGGGVTQIDVSGDGGLAVSNLTPRVGSDPTRPVVQHMGGISIHTPGVGSDDGTHVCHDQDHISIRTPHVGSDP